MEFNTSLNFSAETTTTEKILWREKIPDEENDEIPVPLTEDKTLDTDIARESWEEMALIAVLEENFSPASKLEGGWGNRIWKNNHRQKQRMAGMKLPLSRND